MSSAITVLVTRNFESNLEEIERFLGEADAAASFDALLDTLADVVIPNLERHPDIGRDFLARPIASAEAEVRVEQLVRQLAALDPSASIREYVMPDHLVLYAHGGSTVHLLAVRHHRQLSFDFDNLWTGTP